MKPEEDLPTWLTCATSATDDLTQFVCFIPDFRRLVDSITSTGELPDPIQRHTAYFISFCHREIIYAVMDARVVPDVRTLTDFFQIWIDLGKYGIEAQNVAITRAFYVILDRQSALVYYARCEFTYATACGMCLACGILDECLSVMKNGVKNVDFLDIVAATAMSLEPATKNVTFSDVSACVGNAAKRLVEEDSRAVTATIVSVFNDVFECFRDGTGEMLDFAGPWMDLAVVLVKLDIFEKQFAGMRMMAELLSDPTSFESAKVWFRAPGRTDFLSGFATIHPGLFPPLSDVIASLAEYGLLRFETLSVIWKLHAVQHTSELQKFFSIFVGIGAELDVDMVADFVKMCLNPNAKTEQWFKFICALGKKLCVRADCTDCFLSVRDEIYTGALDGNVWAKAELPELIGLGLSDDDIKRYAAELMNFPDHEFGFDCLAKVVSSRICHDVALREDVMDKIMKGLDDGLCLPSVLRVINGLCSVNNMKMTPEQTKRVYTMGKSCPTFCTITSAVFMMKLVDFGAIMEELRNETVYTKVQSLVARSAVLGMNGFRNGEYVTELPFEGEDFLWEMVCKDGAGRSDFLLILIKLYSSNDGVKLTDYSMMTYVVQKWNTWFARVADKSPVLNMLRTFIAYVEAFVDLDYFPIKRHKIKESGATKTVIVKGKCLKSDMTFELPENTYIAVIREKIARMALLRNDVFGIAFGQTELSDLHVLRNINVWNNNVIHLSVFVLSNNGRKAGVAHQRNIIPSLLIGQAAGEVFDLLLSLLKDEKYCADAKLILDSLPTSPLTKLQVEEISRKRQYDLSKFLPVKFPMVFMYNFEALDAAFTPILADQFMENSGFLYLLKVMQDCRGMVMQIADFLTRVMTSEMKGTLKKDLWETILPFLTLYAQQATKNEFQALATFLTSLDPVEMENGVVQDAMTLLASEIHTVRSMSSNVLAKLPVSMDVFVDMMDNIHDDISVEFYMALLPHIDKPSAKLVEHLKAAFMSDVQGLPALHGILYRMLKNNLIDEEDKNYFTNMLIEKCLVVGNGEHERDLFDIRVSCLTELQNDILFKHLHSVHTNKKGYTSWDIDGDSGATSKTGKCGLENMGAICFLNATLQQFLAIGPIRNKIIEYTGDNDVMVKLSNLFVKMYLGKGRPISPRKLVDTWTGWDGEPMDPMIQQDACEFAQMLIDKLETGISRDIVQGLFGGTTVDRIEGMEVEYQSDRDQPFCTFTLPIAESDNMSEAFQKFQLPDFFTGDNQYHADGIGKINAKKFASLGKLPPNLIMQLGRFEYDYAMGTRTKVNKRFEFPLELDVKEFTANPEGETGYVLTGVIVHMGTADFGHYTSYVKYGNEWFHFNDSDVSQVDVSRARELWYGQRASSAYILFYERCDVQNQVVPEPAISETQRDRIDKSITLENEYAVYCSRSYFDLMRQLATSSQQRFACVAMRYYFDTLPFTAFASDAAKISEPLCDNLRKSEQFKKMMNIIIVSNELETALNRCPYLPVRTGVCDMIKCIDAGTIPDGVISSLFGNPSAFIRYFRVMGQKYELLESIIVRSETARRVSEKDEWALVLQELIMNSWNRYIITEHLKVYDFWRSLDMSGILMLLSHLKCSYQLMDYLVSDRFLTLLCVSTRTRRAAYAALIRSLPDKDDRMTVVLGWAEKQRSCYLSVSTIVFYIYGGAAFRIIPSFQMTIENRQACSFDFAVLLCSLVLYNDVNDLLLNCADRWCVELLCDKSVDCRVAAMYAIMLLVPHPYFQKQNDVFPETPLMRPITLPKGPETPEMLERAKILFKVIRDSVPTVMLKLKETMDAKVTTSKSIAIQFIRVFSGLAYILNEDIRKDLSDMVQRMRPMNVSFDSHIVMVLLSGSSVMSELGDDVVLSLFDQFECQTKKVSQMILLLQCLKPRMMSIVPSDECISDFFLNGAFTGNETVASKYEYVAPYVAHFSRNRPELAFQLVSDHLDTFCRASFSGVLLVLEATNEKLPVLPYLWQAVSRTQLFDMNELVRRACAHSSSSHFNVLPLVSLLNSADLGKEGREGLWPVIIAGEPTFSDFAKTYTWKGDQTFLVDYLVKVGCEECKALLLQAARSDITAFVNGYDLLTKIAHDEIMELTFVSAVLSLDFGSDRAVIDYVEAIFERYRDEQDRLVGLITSRFLMRVRFVTGILDDDCNVTSEDVEPLFGMLSVIREFAQCRDYANADLTDLANACKKSNSPETQRLLATLDAMT